MAELDVSPDVIPNITAIARRSQENVTRLADTASAYLISSELSGLETRQRLGLEGAILALEAVREQAEEALDELKWAAFDVARERISDLRGEPFAAVDLQEYLTEEGIATPQDEALFDTWLSDWLDEMVADGEKSGKPLKVLFYEPDDAEPELFAVYEVVTGAPSSAHGATVHDGPLHLVTDEPFNKPREKVEDVQEDGTPTEDPAPSEEKTTEPDVEEVVPAKGAQPIAKAVEKARRAAQTQVAAARSSRRHSAVDTVVNQPQQVARQAELDEDKAAREEARILVILANPLRPVRAIDQVARALHKSPDDATKFLDSLIAANKIHYVQHEGRKKILAGPEPEKTAAVAAQASGTNEGAS